MSAVPQRKASNAMKRMEIVADLTVQARDAILDEKSLKTKAIANRKKANDMRIRSGQYLYDLKRMIDADRSLSDEKPFWEWFDYMFVKDKICSRKDAMKRIALARAADPKGALEEERRKTRERVASGRVQTNVRDSDTQQNQQDGGENPDNTQVDKAQPSDGNVVSLRVKSTLKAIRVMTTTEREQLYSQLRKENLL